MPSVHPVEAADSIVQDVCGRGVDGTIPCLGCTFDVVGMNQVNPLAVAVRLPRATGVVDALTVDVAGHTVRGCRPHDMRDRLDNDVHHRLRSGGTVAGRAACTGHC